MRRHLILEQSSARAPALLLTDVDDRHRSSPHVRKTVVGEGDVAVFRV